MTTNRMQLAIIVGSTRRGRFCPTAASWFESQARQHDEFDIDLIDLADIKLPELSTETFTDLYPLLPYQIDLIIQVVSGLRTQGGASRHVAKTRSGTSAR
jgi:hypothetical protein